MTIAGKWYPATELAHQMAVWRSFDISESNGLKVDAVIALKFPAYLAPHERKIVWLIHQHRSAYELWDHPDFADLSRQEEGPTVRKLVWNSDRLGLGEAKRIFTNSENVAGPPVELAPSEGRGALPPFAGDRGAPRARPRRAGRLPLLSEPSRDLEAAVPGDRRDAAREDAGQARARRPRARRAVAPRAIRAHGLEDKVRLEVGVSDERLQELYRARSACSSVPTTRTTATSRSRRSRPRGRS